MRPLLLGLSLVALSLGACERSVDDIVRERFAPVSVEDQRNRALNSAAEGLSAIVAPNLALGVPLSTLPLALHVPEVRALGIKELRISGERQLLRIEADFDRVFDDVRGAPPVVTELLARLKPRVVATLFVSASVTGAATISDTDVTKLEVKFLPVFERIRLDRITAAERYDATALGDALVWAINRYAESVTGMLTQLPVMNVEVPARFIDAVDANRIITLPDGAVAGSVTLSGAPTLAGVRLRALAPLIDREKIAVLAQLETVATSPPAAGSGAAAADAARIAEIRRDTERSLQTASSVIEQSAFALASVAAEASAQATGSAEGRSVWSLAAASVLEAGELRGARIGRGEVGEAIDGILREAFGLTDLGEPWVAVRKDFVSRAANDIMARTSLCASSSFAIGRQRFNQTIPIPDENTINCQSTRTCTSNRACNFAAQSDTRSCRACLLYRPQVRAFGRVIVSGGCIQMGNDPVCEASKAAQNAAYEAAAAGRKLDCERLKATEETTCRAEMAFERVTCEAGREVLRRLSRTGNFARIEGGYGGTARANICVGAFGLSPDLSRLGATFTISADADIDANIRFVPLDIIGHLTCQVPWTESARVAARVPAQTISLDAEVRLEDRGGSPSYHFDVDPPELRFTMDPGPLEFMVTSLNMNLACSGPGLIYPLVIPAALFVPELRGAFTHDEGSRSFSVNLRMPRINVSGGSVTLAVGDTPAALVVRGRFEPDGTAPNSPDIRR